MDDFSCRLAVDKRMIDQFTVAAHIRDTVRLFMDKKVGDKFPTLYPTAGITPRFEPQPITGCRARVTIGLPFTEGLDDLKDELAQQLRETSGLSQSDLIVEFVPAGRLLAAV